MDDRDPWEVKVMAWAITIPVSFLLFVFNYPIFGFNGWSLWQGWEVVMMVLFHIMMILAVLKAWWDVWTFKEDE